MFIQGSIKIDNAASAKNYLLLAENASESKNYSDAENYSNKVIEINPNEAKAWFIKGKAAGWQSTVANLRLQETVNCFENAISMSGNDEVFKEMVHKELKDILMASLLLADEHYINYPSTENAKIVLAIADTSINLYKTFITNHELENDSFNKDVMGQVIYAVMTAFYKKILPDYNGNDEHPTNFALEEFSQRVVAADVLLEHSLTIDDDKKLQILAHESRIKILTAKESSKSYRIGSGGSWEVDRCPTDEAKKTIIDMIMDSHNKIKELNPDYKVPARPSPTSNGCYIATAVYGSYDCPEVWVLRRFRDYTLAKSRYGKAFISVYYAISPTFVRYCGKAKPFKMFLKPLLDTMVKSLKQKGVDDAPYNDKHW